MPMVNKIKEMVTPFLLINEKFELGLMRINKHKQNNKNENRTIMTL